MANADSLKFKIHADGDQAKRELRGIKGSLGSLSKASKVMGTALLAAGAATVYATKKSIDYGDWLEKTAQKTGMSVEALSQYRLGAEMAGTSQENLVTGLQKLGKNMGTALRTPTGTMAKAFKDLNVEFEDGTGQLRKLDDVLPDLAEAMSKMTDVTKKGALAQELMGRSGAELIPFLNAGADGLAEMREQSDALGKTWSAESAAAAAEFNDEISELKATLSGMFDTMVQSWLPTLADLVGGINTAMKALAGADKSSSRWSDTLTGEMGRVHEQIEQAEQKWLDYEAALEKIQSKVKDGQKPNKRLQAEIDRLTDASARAKSNFDTFSTSLLAWRKEAREAKAAAGDTIAIIQELGDEADQARVDNLRKQVKKLEESFFTAGQQASALADAQIELLNEYGAATNDWLLYNDLYLKVLDEEKKKLEEIEKTKKKSRRSGRRDRNAALKSRLKGIASELQAYEDSLLTEGELLRKQMAERQADLDEGLRKRLETKESHARKSAELDHWLAREEIRIFQEKAGEWAALSLETMELNRQQREEDAAQSEADAENLFGAQVDIGLNSLNMIQSVAGQLSSIIGTFAEEGNEEAAEAMKALFGITQSAALATAIVNTAVAVSNALAVPPPPVGAAMAVAAGIAGAAQIATIVGTTITGLAHAGMPPGALASAGMNEATILMKRDEMILDPVGTRAISEMLSQKARDNQPVQVNTTLEIDGDVLGRTVDTHLIRSSERGLSYQDRIRY